MQGKVIIGQWLRVTGVFPIRPTIIALMMAYASFPPPPPHIIAGFGSIFVTEADLPTFQNYFDG